MKPVTPILCALALSLSLPLAACTRSNASPSDATTYDARLASLQAELDALRQESNTLAAAQASTHASDAEALTARIDRLKADLAALEATLQQTDPLPERPAEPSTETTPAADGTSDGTPLLVSPPYVYTVSDDRATVVAYCSDQGGKVILPSTLDGYPVTAIGAGAFRGAAITAVAVAPGVESIGAEAFAGCASLGAVTLPVTVTTVEAGAFDNCPGLTIYCARGSAAAMLAEANGWRYIEV